MLFSKPKLFIYRTKDGKGYFQFSYHKIKEGGRTYYEIDIHKTPSYRNLNSSSHTTHWLPCDRPAGKKMCFHVGKEPKTLALAKKYSCDYSELNWHYIRTGITIDQQLRQRN